MIFDPLYREFLFCQTCMTDEFQWHWEHAEKKIDGYPPFPSRWRVCDTCGGKDIVEWNPANARADYWSASEDRPVKLGYQRFATADAHQIFLLCASIGKATSGIRRKIAPRCYYIDLGEVHLKQLARLERNRLKEGSMADEKKEKELPKTRTAKKRCWQCKSKRQVFENGEWFCENKCGPKALADLLRF